MDVEFLTNQEVLEQARREAIHLLEIDSELEGSPTLKIILEECLKFDDCNFMTVKQSVLLSIYLLKEL